MVGNDIECKKNVISKTKQSENTGNCTPFILFRICKQEFFKDFLLTIQTDVNFYKNLTNLFLIFALHLTIFCRPGYKNTSFRIYCLKNLAKRNQN